jgi:UDP-N-acetylmuramoyl-tripeptide--D-alanyl-D-alanine ligase
VNIGDTAYSFEVNAIGEHHIYNALAAIITGLYYKMDVEKIREGVSQFVTGQMRQSISKVGAITIIDDCYNASEDSMKAALKVLSQVGGANRKVAILGDILEQGDFAEKSHRRVGDAVVEYEIDKLITIGKSAAYIADQARKKGALDVSHFEDNEKAAEYILSEVCEKDTVLFKASRGMRLEEISARLKAKFEE